MFVRRYGTPFCCVPAAAFSSIGSLHCRFSGSCFPLAVFPSKIGSHGKTVRGGAVVRVAPFLINCATAFRNADSSFIPFSPVLRRFRSRLGSAVFSFYVCGGAWRY